jgi:hypothetical protein
MTAGSTGGATVLLQAVQAAIHTTSHAVTFMQME